MSGERQRLVETHATRVIALINDQRRAALEGFLAALQGDPPQVWELWGQRAEDGKGWGRPRQPSSLPQPERVLLALRRYLRAEQKEQRHTLRHYHHVAAVEPEKAQQMSFQVLRFSLSNTLLSLRPIPQAFSCPSGPLSVSWATFYPGTPLLCLGTFSGPLAPVSLTPFLSLGFLLPFPESPSCALNPVLVLLFFFLPNPTSFPWNPCSVPSDPNFYFLDVLFLLLNSKTCP